MSTVINVVIWVIPIMFLFHYIRRWYLTAMLFERHLYFACKKTVIYAKKSSKITSIISFSLLLIFIPISYFNNVDIALIFCGLVMLISRITIIAQPPSVLFLGNSNQESIDLFSEIVANVAPFRAIMFLDTDSYVAPRLTKNIRNMDNYRINSSDTNWQKIIHEVSLIAPIIVMDGRRITHSVKQEIEILKMNGRLNTTLFFTFDRFVNDRFPDIYFRNVVMKEQDIISNLRQFVILNTASL